MTCPETSCSPECSKDPATIPVGVDPLKPISDIDYCAGCQGETELIETEMQGVTRTIVMGIDPCGRC